MAHGNYSGKAADHPIATNVSACIDVLATKRLQSSPCRRRHHGAGKAFTTAHSILTAPPTLPGLTQFDESTLPHSPYCLTGLAHLDRPVGADRQWRDRYRHGVALFSHGSGSTGVGRGHLRQRIRRLVWRSASSVADHWPIVWRAPSA